MRDYRSKLVVSNAINMLVEVNTVMVENTKKGKDSELRVPGVFDRAFMLHHETGLIPVVDRLAVAETTTE